MPIPPTYWTAELDLRYELLDEAGRGGMGVVYKARDRETGEIVALKILKPEIAADRVAADRFINEVRLSRRITHKNVTRVYEFTRAGSTAYLSMEYVEGESLRSIVERVGAVNVRKGVQIARQICAALFEAHAQGIVHRDLKPENVMLDRSGSVKVMDFGIARLLDTSVTATAGQIIGTPAYMAPEQAEGRTADARTDIYAVGLILYEIFTGRVAFTGDSPMAVALKQIRETPPEPRTIDPGIPESLDVLIMRCLAKYPAARFESVADLDSALAAVPVGDAPTGSLRIDPEAAATRAGEWPAVASPTTAPLSARDTVAASRSSDTTARLSSGGADRSTLVSAETPKPRPFVSSRKVLLASLTLVLVAAAAVTAFLLLRTAETIPFETFTLDNGLQVILARDYSTPTVGVAVTYKVGSKDDPPGREGLAHLFEHMMFNGSLNVGKGEHHYLVTQQGGVPNGQALTDQTHVWETLPANQLELALFLEADRMRSLRLDQARIDTERGTVIAERQQRIDNQPYGRVLDAMYALAYDIPNYRKHYIGTEDGLRAISTQEINDFFRIFYAPNNAILTLAGQFDPSEARQKIEKYFRHIPAQPPAPDVALVEAEQTAERRARLEDPFAPSPRTYVAYKLPPGLTRDSEALLVLNGVLSDGFASRLHQKLVRELEVALGIGGTWDMRKGPGILLLSMQPAAGRDEDALLRAFDQVITQVHEQGVTAAEIERARTRLRLSRATALQATAQRALILGEYAAKFGDPDLVNDRDRWLASITAEDVQRVARQYLTTTRRSILSVVRGGTAIPTYKTEAAAASQPVATERLNRAPVARDVLRVALPDARETRLDNGLSVLTSEVESVPLVAVRMEFRGAGSQYVPDDDPALAIATGAMLREGTPTRSSREIAEAFDSHGVVVSSGQSVDSGAIYVQALGLSDTFDAWFPILADTVLNASFPADELVGLTRRLAADWQQRRSAPLTVAAEIFDEAVYGPVAGRRIASDAFAALTSDQLRAWHRERYVPQNTIVSVAGRVDRERALAIVRQALGGWANSGATEPVSVVHAPAAARVIIADRPGSVQTTVMAGVAAVSYSDPDHLPLVVANRVLGGGPASRLFVKLRDERGLTFSAYSVLSAFKHGGDWRAYTELGSERTEEGVGALIEELRRIGSGSTPTPELDDAKRAIVAGFAVTLEQLQQIVNYMASRRAYGLSNDYWTRFPEKVMAVTAADVQRAAGKYMDLSRVQIVAVGDAARVEPVFRPFGEVTIVR